MERNVQCTRCRLRAWYMKHLYHSDITVNDHNDIADPLLISASMRTEFNSSRGLSSAYSTSDLERRRSAKTAVDSNVSDITYGSKKLDIKSIKLKNKVTVNSFDKNKNVVKSGSVTVKNSDEILKRKPRRATGVKLESSQYPTVTRAVTSVGGRYLSNNRHSLSSPTPGGTCARNVTNGLYTGKAIPYGRKQSNSPTISKTNTNVSSIHTEILKSAQVSSVDKTVFNKSKEKNLQETDASSVASLQCVHSSSNDVINDVDFCVRCLKIMSTPELPPLSNRQRSLSGSSDFLPLPSKHKKHTETSLLDLASRSPHSFSSSSNNSHLSTTGTSGRAPKSSSLCTSDPHSATKKLDTLFEQKLNQTKTDGNVSNHQSTSLIVRRKSAPDDHKISMGRGNQPVLASLNNHTNSPQNRTHNLKNPGIKRIMSEPKLISDHKNLKNSHLNNNTTRLSYDKTESLTVKTKKRNGVRLHKHDSVDQNGNSGRNGMHINSRRHVINSTELSDNAKLQMDTEDEDYDDEDDERNERVLLWLREVDREAEDPPESNVVYDDTPPQTDNAIHIVYGES